ncbi:ADP-ribose pyrophosphatase YjhB, NUDIX family [Chitinophaga sp. YR573]|jgi:ADP-ribose pyrophosphatase YjhB (NUDIX family)|uniref:NUDIX hydrolase n=1 Tax=Chitinophaga sp. YR573 TaxID=1881040 RepID=UPI0008AC8308|nr:NUDIX domain-containing protein [Chitinophaga sp. YR573]SEV98562.1 ADP-ribose pyrophosphatase YjhB, NUDIX family [Chitinophaga sp. YR573]
MSAQSFYANVPQHLVAVDCIILGFENGKLKLLIMQRKVDPMQGEWSLMGGFLQNEESVDEAAGRVLRQTTGLENIYMEQLACYGNVRRDTGARVISMAYYALIRITEHDHFLAQQYAAHWLELHQIPELIFDHRQMIADALKKLRENAHFHPIGFELLPEKFTLSQLRSLYEEIYQHELDKRNFRKKILSMNILEKLEEKDKTTSKKGAYLYRFDKQQYEELKRRGFVFEI